MNSLDTVTIKYDTFEATIRLSALEELPQRNLRKLFKLASKARHDNEEAVARIHRHLNEIIPEAQDTMRTAAQAYQDGWRKVDKPRSRKPAVVEQLRINQELTANFKQAHARYEKLVRIRKDFDEVLV